MGTLGVPGACGVPEGAPELYTPRRPWRYPQWAVPQLGTPRDIHWVLVLLTAHRVPRGTGGWQGHPVTLQEVPSP